MSADSQNFDLDDVCQRFESEWSDSEPAGVAITRVVRDTKSKRNGQCDFTSRLITELVAIDCELRLKNECRVRRSDYLKCLPDFESEIDDAFDWAEYHLQDGGNGTAPPVLRLGDYKIVREIGRGAMGVVYEAVQVSLDRPVAIKVMSQNPFRGLTSLARFQRETKVFGALHHTNIVEVYGLGKQDGFHYFAMQLIDGRSLDQIIKEKRLDVEESGSGSSVSSQVAHYRWAAKIALQVARALEHSHKMGVLHRDIKPSNLLVDDADVVHVTDFGLAKFQTDSDDLTNSGDIIGTLRYLAPEALQQQTDERSDVFSLAATLYEMLTLQPMHRSKNRLELLEQIAHLNAPSPRHLRPSIPRDLDVIVTKAIESDPQDRYASAGEFAADLERFIRHQPISARPSGPIEQLWKWTKRKPAPAALIFLMALVTFVGMPVVWRLYQNSTHAERLALKEAKRATAAEIATAKLLNEITAERDEKEYQRNRAQQISDFLAGVFQSPDPGRSGHDIRVTELLDAATKQLDSLQHQTERQVLLRSILADTYFSLGLAPQAVTQRERLRDHYTAAEDNERLAILLPRLADAYRLAGRFTDAEAAAKRGLKLSRDVFGRKHQRTLDAVHHLATCYANMRRYADAIPMFEECLPLLEKLTGPEDLDTNATRENLAMCYLFTGQHQQAHDILKSILEVKRRALGPTHARTLTTMGHLGLALYEMNQLDAAASLLQETVDQKREVMGPQHPSTLMTYFQLANSLVGLRKFEKAIAIYVELIPACRNVMGPNHPVTIDTQFNLGAAHDTNGQLEQAIREYKSVIRTMPNHWQAHNNLGNALQRKGDIDQAIVEWQRTLELNPSIQLDTPYILAVELEKQSRDEEALSAYRVAFKNGSVPGSEIPDKLAAFRELASQLNGKLTKWKELTVAARALIDRPDKDGNFPQLEIAANWLEDAATQSPDNPTILTALGMAAYRKQDWDSAVKQLNAAREHGGDSPELLLFLAMANHRAGNAAEAQAVFQEALLWKTDATDAAIAEVKHFFIEARELNELLSDSDTEAPTGSD